MGVRFEMIWANGLGAPESSRKAVQFIFNIRSPLTSATIFLEVSAYQWWFGWDMMRLIFFVLEAPENIRYITIFSFGKKKLWSFGRSFSMDQNPGIKVSPWRFLRSPQIRPTKKSAKTPKLWGVCWLPFVGIFFKIVNLKPAQQQRRFFQDFPFGWKEGKIPTVQNTGWRSSFGDKQICLSYFLCKALALAEEQYLRLRKCWWRIGWKWLNDQSSGRITQCKGCADVRLQQEYTQIWGYLHLYWQQFFNF